MTPGLLAFFSQNQVSVALARSGVPFQYGEMRRLFMSPNRSAVPCLGDRIFRGVMEWVYPRTCLRCGRYIEPAEAGFTCGSCFEAYAFINGRFCARCGSPHLGDVLPDHWCANCREHPPQFSAARSLFRYVGTGARLIHALKYEGGVWCELEVDRLWRHHAALHTHVAGAVLVPVPLHPRKLRRRGYNQAMVVAKGIRRALPDLRIWDGLRRVRDTPTQTALSRAQRQRNLADAFVVDKVPPASDHWVLIDDVLTTGSTLNAAAKALKEATDGRISAFTLAHG